MKSLCNGLSSVIRDLSSASDKSDVITVSMIQLCEAVTTRRHKSVKDAINQVGAL